ncbi:MAG: three-Cys-motif partner protein TcmP [Croceibacterium sp.]
MPIDVAHYVGREPAYVKHTFLDKYLPALIGRIGNHAFDSFVYVDGFAGPWRSTAGENFDDTSFGIALRHMTALKDSFADRGRHVRMKAILVEKDDATFTALKNAVASYPAIECLPLQGEFEDQIPRIQNEIPHGAFSFVLVDPKGFPDMERVLPLLARSNSEALVNFMFDFANRFAGTELLPALEKWLSSEGDKTWRTEVDALAKIDRENRLEALAVEKLRREATYTYSPVISVDKPLQDRTLYKLIFLTRHPKGLEVFRASENAALQAQAASRTNSKAAAREKKTNMSDFFGAHGDVPNDRSSVRLREGEIQARQLLLASLASAGTAGRAWSQVWPSVLNDAVITRSKLGHIVNEMRKTRAIDAPNWPSERKIIPQEEQLLRLIIRPPAT